MSFVFHHNKMTAWQLEEKFNLLFLQFVMQSLSYAVITYPVWLATLHHWIVAQFQKRSQPGPLLCEVAQHLPWMLCALVWVGGASHHVQLITEISSVNVICSFFSCPMAQPRTACLGMGVKVSSGYLGSSSCLEQQALVSWDYKLWLLLLKPLPVDWTALSSVRLYCTSLYIVLLGRLQSLDWTGGLDWWTGLVDWH